MHLKPCWLLSLRLGLGFDFSEQFSYLMLQDMVGECQGGNDHQNLRQALSGFQLEYSERPHVELDGLFLARLALFYLCIFGRQMLL